LSWGKSSFSNSSGWFAPIFFSAAVHGVLVLGGNFLEILDVAPEAPRIFTVELILDPVNEGAHIDEHRQKRILPTVQKAAFSSKALAPETSIPLPSAGKPETAVSPKKRVVKKIPPTKSFKSIVPLERVKVKTVEEVKKPFKTTQKRILPTVQKAAFSSKALAPETSIPLPSAGKPETAVSPKKRVVKKIPPTKSFKSASLGKNMDQILKPKLQNKVKFGNTSASVPTQTGIPQLKILPPHYALPGSGNALPKYPRLARRRGLEGRLMLRVYVSSEGKTKSIKIIKTSGHLLLDRAARQAVKLWKFEPARRAGVPVSGFVNVPVIFKLRN